MFNIIGKDLPLPVLNVSGGISIDSSTKDIFNFKLYRTASNSGVISLLVNTATQLFLNFPQNPPSNSTYEYSTKNNIIQLINNSGPEFKFSENGTYLYNIDFDVYGDDIGGMIMSIYKQNNTVYGNDIFVTKNIELKSTYVKFSGIINHSAGDISKIMLSGIKQNNTSITLSIVNLNIFIEKI